jgi:uncharacterized membrane protein YdfJ with MMPL/SSD domain
VAILFATTATSATAAVASTFAVIVRAGIAPAFASAAMIFDNVGR